VSTGEKTVLWHVVTGSEKGRNDGVNITHDTRPRNRRRIEHCSISKPETGVRETEMMIYQCLLFIFVISCKQGVNRRVL